MNIFLEVNWLAAAGGAFGFLGALIASLPVWESKRIQAVRQGDFMGHSSVSDDDSKQKPLELKFSGFWLIRIGAIFLMTSALCFFADAFV